MSSKANQVASNISAQEMQDEFFRRMPANKKLEVAAGLWLLAKALDPQKIDFRTHGRNRPASSAD